MRTKTSLQADKMLDAAGRLFASQRFHEVRMEDIAAEADVGKGTLYRYFSDKEDLYLALLARASKQFLDRLAEAVQGTVGARQRLTAIVAAVLEFFDEQPHLFDLIQRAEVLRGPDFPWREARSAIPRIVTDIFQNGKAEGEFVIRDPDLATWMLLGGLRGVMRFHKRARPGDLAVQIVTAFLQGAAVRPKSKSSPPKTLEQREPASV